MNKKAKQSREKKIAYHLAGHVVIAYWNSLDIKPVSIRTTLSAPHVEFDRVELLDPDQLNGHDCTSCDPATKEIHKATLQEIKSIEAQKRIFVLLGGVVAEKMFAKNFADAANSYVDEAQARAFNLETSFLRSWTASVLREEWALVEFVAQKLAAGKEVSVDDIVDQVGTPAERKRDIENSISLDTPFRLG